MMGGKMNFSWIEGRTIKRLLSLGQSLPTGDHPSARELRQFGWIFGAITAIVFGLLIPWLLDQSLAWWPWWVALLVWLQAFFMPTSLRALYTLWMLFGAAAGFVNTRIIMLLMYTLLFVPAGMVMRLLGRDALARKLTPDALASYRVPSTVRQRDHFERPY